MENNKQTEKVPIACEVLYGFRSDTALQPRKCATMVGCFCRGVCCAAFSGQKY